VVMVSESATREKVLELVRERRFSRMPVYREKRTDIVGVLNVFDLFYEQVSPSPDSQGEAVREGDISHLVRALPAISRSARIDEALVILREARQPMGLVTGPKKEPVGIITVKDLLEEITGEIRVW
jgi:putative hemolysin